MESGPQPPEQPMPAQVLPPRPFPPPRRRWRGLRILLGLFLLLVLGGSILLNLLLMAGLDGLESTDHLDEEYFSADRFRSGYDKIAIISLEGTILEGDGFVKKEIDQARRDDRVKAVVLRVNSPGGTITGSDYLYHHLTKLRTEAGKPIVVSMGALAASGGYYVAMAAGPTPKTIYAEPTTWTGSIGVVIPHYNAAQLMEQWGIEQDSVASHRLKTMGSFARKMNEEERGIFQALVDESFDRFKTLVRKSRPDFQKNPEKLDQLATGQIFSAEQAKADGLVDQIGFLEDAVDRAIELAGADPENVRVVRYRRTLSLTSLLLGAKSQSRGSVDLATLLDLSAPRAYYLSTQFPPLVRNAR